MGRHGRLPGHARRLRPPAAGWWALGAAGLAGLAAVAALPPALDSPSFCLLRATTGLGCPGCGLTRALERLVAGDLAAAIGFHPLAPVLALEAAALWLAWGVGGRRVADSPWLARLAVVNAAALVALWLGRLATGTLPV